MPLIADHKESSTPMVAIGPQSFSPIRSLVWPAASSTTFLQRLAHWHVPRATWHQLLRDWYHRLSAFLARRMVPRQPRSAQPFVLQVPKCLNGHRHTNIIESTFFRYPPEEIFDHGFNAKALKPLFSTILKNDRPALHIALPCVKVVDFFYRDSNS